MTSDIKSVQETGGGAPRPYVPPQGTGQYPAPQNPSGIAGHASQNPSGIAGHAPQAPGSIQGKGVENLKPSLAPSPMVGPAKKPAKGFKKGIFTLIISLIIVLGAGVIGYFFVFPLFGGSDATTPPTTTPPPASPIAPGTPDEGTGLFDIPSGNVDVPPATDTVTPTTPPASVPPPSSALPPAHTSFLSIPADLASKISIESVTVGALQQAIGFTTAQVASLKEVVLTRDGSPLRLSDLGSGLLPQFFTEDVSGLFEEDFTYAVYTDTKGSWPVYVFRVSPSRDIASAKSKFAMIEKESAGTLGNLYLSSPGGTGTWKDGQILGTPGRYVTFTQAGASLNYLWLENFLVVGTSYAATQETVKRLGS
ncbi:MAG: hypothetical protein Q8R20_03420 [Nanoarchaeota archaeon]|nr:hypothetical protein [Nanoarchaeota archaeon]